MCAFLRFVVTVWCGAAGAGLFVMLLLAVFS